MIEVIRAQIQQNNKHLRKSEVEKKYHPHPWDAGAEQPLHSSNTDHPMPSRKQDRRPTRQEPKKDMTIWAFLGVQFVLLLR